MDPQNPAGNPLSNLQFTTNEPASPTISSGGLTCIGCKRPIESSYYALADQVICPGCRDTVTAKPPGSGIVRFFKASMFGVVAGLIGALIWYLIRVLANLQIGLIAILVGFMVGKAIHVATGGRGGLKYQFLAVLITYSCIAVNYVPDILQALVAASREEAGVDLSADPAAPTTDPAAQAADREEPMPTQPAGAGADKATKPLEKLTGVQLLVGVVLIALLTMILALATPILAGLESPIGLLIVGFALWEAWKFAGHKPLSITGPYQVGQPGSPLASPAAPPATMA